MQVLVARLCLVDKTLKLTQKGMFCIDDLILTVKNIGDSHQGSYPLVLTIFDKRKRLTKYF